MAFAELADFGEQVIHANRYKLDQTNLSSWIAPPFAKKSDWSNYAHMEKALDIGTVRENLQRVMQRTGKKPTTLSLAVGSNRTLVKDLLEKASDVQLGTLVKLAGALDVSLSELIAAPRVRIAGYIGAGGEVIFEEHETGDTVMRPPGVSGDLFALMVRGSSMLPKYRDGDVIYIQRQHDGVIPEDIGEDCAVQVEGAGLYIKQLVKGSDEGRFTLLSLNAPPMENVEVEWATPVLLVMPARARFLLG